MVPLPAVCAHADVAAIVQLAISTAQAILWALMCDPPGWSVVCRHSGSWSHSQPNSRHAGTYYCVDLTGGVTRSQLTYPCTNFPSISAGGGFRLTRLLATNSRRRR